MHTRAALAVATGVLASIAWAEPASAHGIGGRSDLPLPLWQVTYGAAIVLVVSFFALGRLWREPRLETGGDGRPLPELTSRVLRGLAIPGRGIALTALALVWTSAAFGNTTPLDNLAPVAIYVVFWVGMMVVSALVGDIWSAINPFDTLGRGVRVVAARLGVEERPYRFGHWPAAAFLAAFLWLELVYHDPASPRVLALALITYTAVILAGAAIWGRPWLREGEAFAAFFGLLSAMAPLYRGDDGRLYRRAPFRGLATLRPGPGAAALVLVALGGTGFDGLSRITFWGNLVGNRTGWEATFVGTLGLVWAIGIVTILFRGAMWGASRVIDVEIRRLVTNFVHSIIPIAFAYVVAHYFSLLVFEGQSAIALVSDPLGRGWDLFGTADRKIDYLLVSTATIGYVQTVAIVGGHLVGVVIAHDRAVATIPEHLVAPSQYPLLIAMVTFTVGGLFLLFGG